MEEEEPEVRVQVELAYPPTNHLQVVEEVSSPTPTATSNDDSTATGSSQENGLPLTFEQEQTADELLADIQNAVDEMLENFQFGPGNKNSQQRVPPKPMKKPEVKKKMVNGTSDLAHDSEGDRVEKPTTHVVKMQSRNGGFGFQVMGGSDSNIPAQVDFIVPGMYLTRD